MPLAKLGGRELVCAEVLFEKGASVRGIARQLGVDESTVRYHFDRRRAGAEDGRKGKDEACADFDEDISAWLEEQKRQQERGGRPESVRCLFDLLRAKDPPYTGSYKAVVRYVERRRERPKLRPKRRVETRPGAQMQIDWGQVNLNIDDLGGLVQVSAFCLTLSFSRMWVVVWRLTQTMLSWLSCHNQTLLELNGVPAYARIDNLKTGVSRGVGPWGTINPGYRSYAGQVGFLVDPCLPARGDHKGKVERRVQDVKRFHVREKERFSSLESLQATTDQRRLERAQSLICPVTGDSMYESWRRVELASLKPLPETMPTPFDVQVSRPVSDDCLVSFEGRQYMVPFTLMRRTVDVRGCADTVEILSDNQVVRVYPRGTACRLLVDQSCLEGSGDGRVRRPMPLGRVAREIVLERSWEAAARPIDEYARVVEQQ